MPISTFNQNVQKLIEEAVKEKFIGKKLRIQGKDVEPRIVTVTEAEFSHLSAQYSLILKIENAPSGDLNRVYIPQPGNKYFGAWEAKLGYCQNSYAEVCERYFRDDRYLPGRIISIEFFRKSEHFVVTDLEKTNSLQETQQ